MKQQVNFKIVNDEFDNEYAERYNEGQPSANNPKYLQTWKFEIESVKSIELIESGSIGLQVTDISKKSRSLVISEMMILRCKIEDGSFQQFAVSNQLIRNHHQTKGRNYASRFYFYLKQEVPFFIIDGVNFIAKDAFSDGNEIENWTKVIPEIIFRGRLIELGGVMSVKGRPDEL
jgi:hypothetical protein